MIILMLISLIANACEKQVNQDDLLDLKNNVKKAKQIVLSCSGNKCICIDGVMINDDTFKYASIDFAKKELTVDPVKKDQVLAEAKALRMSEIDSLKDKIKNDTASDQDYKQLIRLMFVD